MKRVLVVVLLSFLCSSAAAQTVTKLTTTNGVVVNPATSDNQTNGNQKVQVTSAPTTTVNIGNAGSVSTEATLATISSKLTGSTLTVAGNKTPSDTFSNPSDAINSWSFVAGWNAANSQWRRVNSGLPASSFATTVNALDVRSVIYAFDGANVSRMTGDTTNGLDVDVTRMPPSYELEVAAGNVTGAWSVNKFGSAPMGVQTTATDIWSRADATPTQQIWLAPTAARIHGIVSTDANDDGSPAGTGARTVTVYGLTSWSASAETSETITTNGTTTVNTVNSYVIIHRMKVATSGTSGPNVGTITATAATNNTITAVILPGEGQTEMAIYGVPSTKSLYMKVWCANIDRSVAASTAVDFRLMVNETPDTNPTVFLRKNDISLQTGSTTQFCKQFDPPLRIQGPAIVKIQGIASSADVDAESSFDGIVK